MPRPRRKTEVATIKLTPEVRRAWEAAAESERRSLANVFEVAILEYVKRHHIAVPKDAAALAAGDIARTDKEEQPREEN
jgi:predicted transcriptional regulator